MSISWFRVDFSVLLILNMSIRFRRVTLIRFRSTRREACQRRTSLHRRSWHSLVTIGSSFINSRQMKAGKQPNVSFERSFASRPVLRFHYSTSVTILWSRKNTCHVLSTTLVFASTSKRMINWQKPCLQSKRKKTDLTQIRSSNSFC